MILKPITSEKAAKMIERDNTLLFATERRATKEDIKKEIESLFNVKVDAVRTFIKHNEKYVYVRLKKQHPAIDIATKLGMM